MKRLLNTSSITGSASVPTATRAGARRDAASARGRGAVMRAGQPGSTTVVALRLDDASPGRAMRVARAQRLAAVRSGASCQRAVAGRPARVERGRRSRSRGARAPARRRRRVGRRADRLDRDRLDRPAARRPAWRSRSGRGAPRRRRRASARARRRRRRARCRCPGIAGAARRVERGCAASGTPCAATSARAAAPSASSALAAREAAVASSRRSTACSRDRADVGEAHAIGRQHAGERVDEARVAMPSASATRQACWPPAPPKHGRQ